MVQASFKETHDAETERKTFDCNPVLLHEAGQQHLGPEGSQEAGRELLAVRGHDDRASPLAQEQDYGPGRVVVTRSNFEECLSLWLGQSKITLDTETTGLRPYHGDRLFSLILATPQVAHYFNFRAYPGLEPEYVLLPAHLDRLKSTLFARTDVEWAGHHLVYDLHTLAQDGIELQGALHCTRNIARVEYNEHMGYSLDACAARIGLKKDDAVEKYIHEHHLTEKRQGANQAFTHKFFDRVPYSIMVPYGLRDGSITAALAEHQEKACEEISRETPLGLPALRNIVANEKRLTRTVFRMERVGLRVDRDYCLRASRYEADRAEKAARSFKALTGREFLASPKLFGEVFQSDRENWGLTENGNPSFDSDSLSLFKNPAAKEILTYRDAKSKADFYRGFLYHADAQGDVHPNFNPAGAATGRFSSSDPNFQNLVAPEEGEDRPEFEVRRAIIPRPGFLLYSLDWSAVEYILFFEYICKSVGRLVEIARQIRHEGKDPHTATADAVTAMGTSLQRKRAKAVNFAQIYGAGNGTLAATIGGTVAEAAALRALVLKATPEMQPFLSSVMRAAEKRGFIRNWAGRRLYCSNPRFSYKMVNWLIQGGAADINKFALNRVDELLLGRQSRLIANVHDELILEMAPSEVALVQEIKTIMETTFPGEYMRFPTSVEWSEKSLGDLHA